MATDKNPKNAGRTKKYTTEELKRSLYSFIEEYGGKITISKLVKYSGVPRHIWDYNEEIQTEIERLSNPLNRMSKIQNFTSFDFKSIDIEQIVQNSTTSKNLIFALNNFKQQAEIAFEEGLKYNKLKAEYEAKEIELNDKITSLENKLELKTEQYDKLKTKHSNILEENAKMKNAIDCYEKQLLEYGLDSTSIITRKEKNIKDNVVEYNPKREEEENLIKAFPTLFGK